MPKLKKFYLISTRFFFITKKYWAKILDFDKTKTTSKFFINVKERETLIEQMFCNLLVKDYEITILGK